MNKKIAVIGYQGKMGDLTCKLLENEDGYEVVAKIGRNDDLDQILKKTKPDIALDFTSHLSVFTNIQIIIENGVRPLIGSSGLSLDQIQVLQKKCAQKELGGLIIPNFSLGIAVLNKMAMILENNFDEFSVIEYHHSAKKDKPSGTARHMANLLNIPEDEIASVRGDGFVAKLQVYANTPYERLILDHESFDRKSFVPGIMLSLNQIMQLNHMVVGLENILL